MRVDPESVERQSAALLAQLTPPVPHRLSVRGVVGPRSGMLAVC